MTKIDLIRKINLKMNYANFDTDDFEIQFDEATDMLNDYFKVDLPVLGDLPLYKLEGNPLTKVPTEIFWLSSEVLRRFVVPYVAGAKMVSLGRDGSPELAQATAELTKLGMKYRPTNEVINGVVIPDTELLNKNFDGAYENQDVQFSGHDNYGYDTTNSGNPLDPLSN